ncbi:DinB family protein [Streptomonospora nanhaiensis]|uniref:Putative damage-inducible protein DinB n=1 Tax=Streptomonospora nanhaiensis TaxID=1323731 RepID=A0A853BIG4_9ACTN|nr:DinB family protein [Streptomonospora nanhaiensis]MBV2362528.1 DinB family protein [Streptomonospora nanhaiensis]MBX9391996.1 DinB family protein [Streptomonospora nanhaiensis]NYI94810.1 putative damage-inducible protein DinB [Streptomonospora nanhaiensis]
MEHTIESVGTSGPARRVEPPHSADERTMLTAWLDWHRSTVREKCAGLDSGAARRAPLPTSPLMSIGGIVSHLRWVEHAWFESVLLGLPDQGPYTRDDPDAEWRLGARVPLAELLDAYDAQCARSREITARLELGSTSRGRASDGPRTLRWVLVHMIEETARHNGHLDLLREAADGARGR